MKSKDKFFRRLILGAIVVAIGILVIVNNVTFSNKSNSKYYASQAFKSSEEIVENINEIALRLYLENEATKSTYSKIYPLPRTQE